MEGDPLILPFSVDNENEREIQPTPPIVFRQGEKNFHEIYIGPMRIMRWVKW